MSYNYEGAYDSATMEIRRLHSVCREYRKEKEALRQIIHDLIDLTNESKVEIPAWLSEKLKTNEDIINME